MAYDLSGLSQKYRFFAKFGSSAIDKTFIEDVLLPGLNVQGRFGGSSLGIELPHGLNEPAEYIDLDDAARIVLDWFERHSKIDSDDNHQLESLLKKGSYADISILLHNIMRKRVIDPQRLLSSRLAENLASYKEVQDQAIKNQGKVFNPASDVIRLSQNIQKIRQLASRGIAQNIIVSLIPPELTDLQKRLTQTRLTDVIAYELPEILSEIRISQESQDPELIEMVAGRVTRIIERGIARDYPDMVDYLNFTKDNRFEKGSYQLGLTLEKSVKALGISISDLENDKIKATSAIPFLIPGKNKLAQEIIASLSIGSPQERQQIASALVAAMVSTTGKQLNSEQIISTALKSLPFQLTNDQLKELNLSLHNNRLDHIIEYYQRELAIELEGVHLTSAEKKLRSLGINPLDAHFKLDDLGLQANKILSLTGDPLAVGDARSRIEDRYNALLSSGDTNSLELFRLRSWLDRHDTLLTVYDPNRSDLRRLSDRGRRERWIYNASSRFRNAETAFWDKWLKFEDNLPWNKGLRAAFNAYDRLAEKVYLPIPLPGGKTAKIPVLRLMPWIFEGIDNAKRTLTLRAFRSLSRSNWGIFDPIRKYIRFSLREYSLGGYTVDGAVLHFTGKIWGKAIGWSISKLGASSIFKYSAQLGGKAVARNAGRAFIRLAISIGGKALGKIASSLVVAASGIGVIFSLVGLVSLALDLIKLGVNFIKEFLHNANFREKVLEAAAFFGTIGTFIVTIPSLIIGAIVGAFTTLISGIVPFILGIVGFFFFVTIIGTVFKHTIKIDPGLGLFQAIFCNDEKTEGEQNQSGAQAGGQVGGGAITQCATCLVKYLTACYGNPITGSKVSSKLGCLLAQKIAPEVAEAIKASAVGYTYLQCVGFARASALCAGGDLEGRAVASDYIRSPASGYRYVAGAGSCAPGDMGLIDGAIGHIFVVGSNDGGTIRAIDANFTCSGCVSDNNPIPSNRVAGCMKRK